MPFVKYQHVEKYGTSETEDIELGECYVFPKIDGTNSSVWFEDGEIKAGSRNRELSLEQDNAGFYNSVKNDEKLKAFFAEYPHLRIYGEWLVPHTVKTYKDEAWRKFYVFDVMDGEQYIHYNQYKLMLEKYNIDYIPPVCVVNNGTDETFIKALELNTYLVKDGQGIGEGVVIKRYGYVNKYGRTVWAKIVTSEFKEKHSKTMGAPVLDGELTVERKIVDDCCTVALIEKEYAKIAVDGWTSKNIPRLLHTVYYSIVTETLWHCIKKHNNPTIDFKKLQKLCNEKVKQVKTELF